MDQDLGAAHPVMRVRHETRRRQLTVRAIEDITPRMRRITCSADTMEGFVSLAPDDHIKLFFPGDAGPQMRDFTPRRFDVDAGMLEIDFALHEAGPANAFAAAARPGDTIEIGGPRGSAVIAGDFDWYWLIGDETALPAIGRRLEEATEGTLFRTFVLVEGLKNRQMIETRATWRANWIFRSEGESLLDAVRRPPLPAGDGLVWLAGEHGLVRGLRHHFVEERNHPEEWVRASSYWRLPE